MRHEDAEPRLPELVGLHAAGPDDAGLRAHVAGCDRCGARLRALRDIDARLRAIGPAAAPSQRLERRVLAIPTAAGAPARTRTRWPWAAAAACVILLLGALVGVLATGERPSSDPGFSAERTVRLTAPDGAAIEARVEVGRERDGRVPVRIVASGLPHGGDRYYGLWLTGGSGSVSGGSFRPDGEGRCVVVLTVPAGSWSGIDLTAGDRPPSTRTTVASGDL